MCGKRIRRSFEAANNANSASSKEPLIAPWINASRIRRAVPIPQCIAVRIFFRWHTHTIANEKCFEAFVAIFHADYDIEGIFNLCSAAFSRSGDVVLDHLWEKYDSVCYQRQPRESSDP